MYDFSDTLATVVQTARIAHGLTQDQLAEYVGITGKSISNIERGVANPEFGSIYTLFRRLGIDANSVFYPEHKDEKDLKHQFQLLLAGCTDDELELLLAVSRALLVHLRKHDALGEVADCTV